MSSSCWATPQSMHCISRGWLLIHALSWAYHKATSTTSYLLHWPCLWSLWLKRCYRIFTLSDLQEPQAHFFTKPHNKQLTSAYMYWHTLGRVCSCPVFPESNLRPVSASYLRPSSSWSPPCLLPDPHHAAVIEYLPLGHSFPREPAIPHPWQRISKC